ncbi:hypothetical protein EYW49_03665 [Siculibacillus lacustris]|uniref:Uncharacterized protein n=1 Tax=Siculibacillus lacustris TaxID=1549641 RepID=A0A4Q9VVT4_9HYPH|nr:hypothetical protein [Siculibacillus lacustris]TBW40290.1 hypothetical protein EYW49_03665 [Siculibacillus lacustris]
MDPLFAIGDSVSYGDRHEGRSLHFTVVKVMPVEHAVQTYRIRDDGEAFERAVPESALTRIEASPEAKLFDH